MFHILPSESFTFDECSTIAKRNMSAARAKRIEEELDDTKPFYCRIEVIEAMAALCALHPQEVMKKVTGANKPLYNLLWSAIL